MANYYFRLRDTNATKPTPIILFAQVNGNRIKCKTNECILPELWDQQTKLPKRKKETKVLTDRLTYLLSVANDTYLYFRDVLKVSEPISKDFQKKFYELSGIDYITQTETVKSLTLFEFIDKFISEAAHRQNEHTREKISVNTIKVYKRCRRLLHEFSQTVTKIDFNRLNLDTLLDFINFLNNKQFGINTIAKYVRTFKLFLNEAYERGYTDSLVHKSKRFRVKEVEPKTIYLKENELDELYKLDLTKFPHLDRVRDLFLVGCYTGLRFSDFTAIQPENIDGGYIEIKTKKTKIDTVIPIHPVVNEIMNKYEGRYINRLPPAISNQKFNKYLKEVCAMCETLRLPVENATLKTKTKGPQILKGIPKYKLVSSHTARRSFATNQYRKGISANILMKITGHKTEKSFYTYIRETPKENAERLRELWQREYSHLKVV